MTAPDLLLALTPVADALDALGARYYVAGSLASSARGLGRASLDVDVVAALGEEAAGAFVERLRDRFYVSEDAVRDAIRERSSFNVIHLATMMKVDVFVAGDGAFDRDALARATPELLDEAEPGRSFPVASAEDVVLAKLRWFRLGGERSERQWGDVLGVLRLAGTAIDHDYLDRHAVSLDVAGLLARARVEAVTG